jgi:hypothetical protein
MTTLVFVFIGFLSLMGKARNMPGIEKVDAYSGKFKKIHLISISCMRNKQGDEYGNGRCQLP